LEESEVYGGIATLRIRDWNCKMKFLYCVVPFLGGLAFASESVAEKCLCPEVKCPGNDAVVSHMFKLFELDLVD
jgi:hypothetical protein